MGRQLLINFDRVLSTRGTVWWESGIVEGATNHGPAGWKDRRPRQPRSRRMNSLLNTVVISFDWAHAARRRPDEDSTASGSVPSAPTSTLRFSSSYLASSMALQWLRTRSINRIPLLVYTSSIVLAVHEMPTIAGKKSIASPQVSYSRTYIRLDS